jgi:hypothetical protein
MLLLEPGNPAGIFQWPFCFPDKQGNCTDGSLLRNAGHWCGGNRIYEKCSWRIPCVEGDNESVAEKINVITESMITFDETV